MCQLARHILVVVVVVVGTRFEKVLSKKSNGMK
jgi:hypothetical protein